MNVLALNAGSSTIKYRLIAMPGEEVLDEGVVEHTGAGGMAEATERIVSAGRGRAIGAVGHRFVHGGPYFEEPVILDRDVLDRMETLRDLDPIHNPVQLALAKAAMARVGGVPHVAVFDTAFHRTIPPVAALYALPRDLSKRLGLRRYGFHGLSHAFVSRALLAAIGREPEGTRLIVCHLGNGASVCAVKDGKSVDTSMGFTPLEGLVMGTRCGDIDPGLILYLLRDGAMAAADLDALLNERSGLLGLSGLSGDVRRLESAASDPSAALALDVFAYRLRKYIGAYAAAMGGLDAVAFSGGIGEHSAAMRARICEGLSFLGIVLNPQANEAADGAAAASIGDGYAKVPAWVIPTNEELVIARDAASKCGQAAAAK